MKQIVVNTMLLIVTLATAASATATSPTPAPHAKQCHELIAHAHLTDGVCDWYATEEHDSIVNKTSLACERAQVLGCELPEGDTLK